MVNLVGVENRAKGSCPRPVERPSEESIFVQGEGKWLDRGFEVFFPSKYLINSVSFLDSFYV